MPAITFDGRAIYKNGYPHIIRAVNYACVPIGVSQGEWVSQPTQLAYDLDDIAAAGFNCIKVYVNAAYDVAEYDAAMALCTAKGIDVMALVFITYDTDLSVATGAATRAIMIDRFTTMINRVKQYPAVIGYGFGNENNYHLGATSKGDWYQLVNEACLAGKAIDATRFFYTANGEVADMALYDAIVPAIDVWGANIYRGTSFGTMYTLVRRYTKRPFIVTEFGTNRLNATTLTEQQAVQASGAVAQCTELAQQWPQVCGYAYFQWVDGWSKAGNPSVQDLTTEEWWGITGAVTAGYNAPRPKTQAYNDLKTYLTVAA